jgi:serine protease Do
VIAATDDLTNVYSQLSDDFAAMAERLRRSTVLVRGRGPGAGSGVIWRSDGLIVTNAHVARGQGATVVLWDGRSFDASLLARAPEVDLAALKIEAEGLPAAVVADSSRLRVGELVLAVGNPLGLVGALTAGIISAAIPEEAGQNGRGGHGWIQADVRLAPGNSGGPLADARGRVIGINSMVAGGFAIAVPGNSVQDFLSDLEGRPERPRLGVSVQPVLLPQNDKRLFGLLILEVEPASLAERSGLAIGDVLMGTGAQRFERPSDLSRALSDATRASEADRLTLEFMRGGRRVRRDVMLGPGKVE